MSRDIPLLPGFMARGIERWAARRMPAHSDRVCLDRRRIYILPSRNGMIFGFVLMIILLGAINYQNSLGYMLTFLILSIMFLGMIATHHNLDRLCLSVINAAPVFAGQTARFNLSLSDDTGAEHIHIQLQCPHEMAVTAQLTSGYISSKVELPVSAPKRGYLHLPRLRLFSEFPLGLFHAWTWIELNAHCLVYPAPAEHPPQFELRGRKSGSVNSEQSGEDDFANIREYQSGDSPRRMAWKAIARSGVLQTKTFHAEAGDEIWLSWRHLPDSLGIEQRLSILCRWVLDAHRLGLSYGLDIPGTCLQPGSGQLHEQQCLRALALFGTERN